MSLSPIALEALRAAQAAFTEAEADVFEDALARGMEALDREGRLVGAFAASELARLESLVNAQPAALSEAQVEALAAAGNGAVNDHEHERQCGCSEYPGGCVTDRKYRRAVGYWDSGVFEIGMAAVIGVWESIRADAVAAELGRLRARVDEVERAYTFDTAELKQKLDVALKRVAELEAQRAALAERLRAGQRWQRGRNPALVSQDFVGQDELRAMFGIPLTAPWDDVERRSIEESADKLTWLLASALALREDEPAEVFVSRTERSYWVAIVDALNAAVAAGMPIGIDLDGTLTDHNAWSVVWDRAAERWTVAGYEDAEAGDA